MQFHAAGLHYRSFDTKAAEEPLVDDRQLTFLQNLGNTGEGLGGGLRGIHVRPQAGKDEGLAIYNIAHSDLCVCLFI